VSAAVAQSLTMSIAYSNSGELRTNNRPIFSMLVFPKVTPCHFMSGRGPA
jgi:hypothetical protein